MVFFLEFFLINFKLIFFYFFAMLILKIKIYFIYLKKILVKVTQHLN